MNFLLPDSLVQYIRQQKREFFEHTLVPQATDWNEDTTKFSEYLCLRGESFRPFALFDVTPVLPDEKHLAPEKCSVSPCGRFLYARRVLPRGDALMLAQGRRHGEVCFTTDVLIPILAEISPDNRTPRVWMSFTPHEVISQRRGLQLGTGKVLVGGLGLGWFLQKICAKSSVQEVILVEKQQSLVDWLLPRIFELWPHVEEKLQSVIVGDAIEHIGKHGDDTRYLLDIWELYGDARKDRLFQGAKAKDCIVWGWGDVDRGKS